MSPGERLRTGRYDLVLFLAAFSSYKSAVFVRACREVGLPVIYLNRGYSVTAVPAAIHGQCVPRPGRPRGR